MKNLKNKSCQLLRLQFSKFIEQMTVSRSSTISFPHLDTLEVKKGLELVVESVGTKVSILVVPYIHWILDKYK